MYSIIITTYNRPKYLQRLLSYYDTFRLSAPIIVADSSSDEIKAINKRIVGSFPNINANYLESYSTQTHKIDHASNIVNTKYCLSCSDDDFITPNGIEDCVNFLEKNTDFTVAHGQYIAFWLENVTKNKQEFRTKLDYLYPSIEFPDAKSRLEHYFANYGSSTLCAVYHTDFMRMVFSETTRFADYARFGELLPSIISVIYGKMKRLETLYCARDSGSAYIVPYPTFADFIKDGTYDDKYEKFRECLATHLTKNSDLDTEAASTIINNAMSSYVNRYKEYFVAPPPASKTKKKILFDYLHLPDWMDTVTAKIYARLFKRPTSTPAESRHDFSTPEYYEDLAKIRSLVLLY